MIRCLRGRYLISRELDARGRGEGDERQATWKWFSSPILMTDLARLTMMTFSSMMQSLPMSMGPFMAKIWQRGWMTVPSRVEKESAIAEKRVVSEM